MSVAVAGWVVIGGVVAVVAHAVWDAATRSLWRRRQTRANAGKYHQYADAVRRDQESIFMRSIVRQGQWQGYRQFIVVRKKIEAPNIVSFFLKPRDGKPIADHQPGQYLTFRFQRKQDNQPLVRCYSLSQDAGGGQYRITVKLIAAPPGKPEHGEGKASGYLHWQVAEGDVVEARQPAGGFTLGLSQGRPMVMIAGGIGITPLYTMVEHSVNNTPEREIRMFYGARHGGEAVMNAQLNEWNKRDNFHLVRCFSAPQDGETKGEGGDYDEEGYVTAELLRRRLPSSNYEYFVCGPSVMMTKVIEALREWGVPQESIHWEMFSQHGVREKSRNSPVVKDAKSFPVSFRDAGKACMWNPDTGTVLDVAEDNGVPLPFGCRTGNCGTCATKVLSGKFEYVSRPGFECEEGKCLACVAVPTTALELA